MSTFTKTHDFTESGLSSMITDLNNVKAAYNGEAEASGTASVLFTLLGLMGGPAGVCVTTSLLVGAMSIYYTTVVAAVDTTLAVAIAQKDYLQDHSNYDKVRLELTYKNQSVNGKLYIYPTNMTMEAVHSINPPGWNY